MNSRRLLAATAATGLLGGALLAAPASAHDRGPSDNPAATGTAPGLAKQGKVPPGLAADRMRPDQGNRPVQLRADLSALNFSGASGTARATLRGETVESISVRARGLSPDAPHAVHIHYGEDARNECPTMAADATQTRADGTLRLNVVDGVPKYGPIAVSLTTSGNTSPSSGLALDRFPVAMGGALDYRRSGIGFTDVAGAGAGGSTATAAEIAAAVRAGEGVVVVHGVDYNANGRYDFASAGASELDADAPAEATDPALCGVLHRH